MDARIEDLRSRQSAAANRSAELLEIARESWAERIDVVTSHDDLVFVQTGEDWRSARSIRVAWKDSFYEFWYRGATGVDGLTAADRCGPENASAVLDAFLMQLVD